MYTIHDVIKSHLCVSCGACVGLAGSATMELDKGTGMFLPNFCEVITGADAERLYDVCPGKGYDIKTIAQELFGDGYENLDLGTWRGLHVARSLVPEYSPKASSGGIVTGIAAHLIEKGYVEGAVVTGMKYGSDGPQPHTFVARSREELVAAQGSKYCPVPALEKLPQMERFPGRLVYIGTPCQIAALRMIQRVAPKWKEKIPYCIGSFCGGFRDCRETMALIKRGGFRPSDVIELRYRGGGQPGYMIIADRNGRTIQWRYPGYARKTGYPKHYRCRLCVDATAELADFSCGDAWIPRFLESKVGWSILITRSTAAEVIVEQMVDHHLLDIRHVTVD